MAVTKIMKGANIITIEIFNKITPQKCFQNTFLEVGRVRRGNLE